MSVQSAQGEDRSNWQAVLPPVDRNGKLLDFIWFKASEGPALVDKNYAANVALAKQHGVPFGSYHYLHPSLSIPEQIALFMATVAEQGGLEPGAMLAVDSEISSGANGKLMLYRNRSELLECDPHTGEASIKRGVTYPHHLLTRGTPTRLAAGLVDLATREFLIGVRTAVEVALGGDYCQELVYTFLNMASQLTSCTDFPLWIADFTNAAPTSVHPWSEWTIWQYAGGGGNGGSDQDGFNGTAEAFNAWRLSKIPQKPPPPPLVTGVSLTVSLPELSEGSVDVPGQVDFVHRVQWLLAGLAKVANIPQAVGLSDDGIYGPKTAAAVAGMQAFAKLTPSGKVGEDEWKFLYAGIRGNA
jgi:Glycosyl hydrolases family 25/Putative peptidoglycan binding domain